MEAEFSRRTPVQGDAALRCVPHLLRAHVQLGADLARVPGQEWGGCESAGLVLILLLVHRRHQAEVAHFDHVIHGEEDVGGLQRRRPHIYQAVLSFRHVD